MKLSVDQYFDNLSGKHALVLGIGVSNRPLIQLLLNHGVFVTACDKTPYDRLDPEVLDLEQQGAVLHVGETYLDDLSADIVFRTPGMHPDTPAIRALCDAGAELTSEMEVFFQVCPCPIIAITGSDGKTTTTTIIGEILRQAGKRVWVGGNIGQPLLPLVHEMKSSDIAVVELSSFQLLTMDRSPTVAVITNLAPNHLDVHKDMEEYIAAKKNIYRHQRTDDRLVLNLDNEITRSFASSAAASISWFSMKQDCAHVYCSDGVIFRNHKPLMKASEILIPGQHNIENYMAAICAVQGLADDSSILHVARNFKGVEHRIELVRELNGVRYYNDSIASTPTRTIAGLHSFHQKVILIAGGYDKHIPFDNLGVEIVDHVKRLILCGTTAEQIRSAVLNAEGYCDGFPEISVCDSLENAVSDAYHHAKTGDVVTLSPACAAFDQFKNFMVRGNRFKEIVSSL